MTTPDKQDEEIFTKKNDHNSTLGFFERLLNERTDRLTLLVNERTAQFKAILAAADKALMLAREVLEAWKLSANEWRGAMSDLSKLFARQPDLEAVSDRVRKIEDWKNTLEGKADQKDVTRLMIISLISITIGLTGAFFSFISITIAIISLFAK